MEWNEETNEKKKNLFTCGIFFFSTVVYQKAIMLKYWPANNSYIGEWRERFATSANSSFNVFKLFTNQLVN